MTDLLTRYQEANEEGGDVEAELRKTAALTGKFDARLARQAQYALEELEEQRTKQKQAATDGQHTQYTRDDEEDEVAALAEFATSWNIKPVHIGPTPSTPFNKAKQEIETNLHYYLPGGPSHGYILQWYGWLQEPLEHMLTQWHGEHPSLTLDDASRSVLRQILSDERIGSSPPCYRRGYTEEEWKQAIIDMAMQEERIIREAKEEVEDENKRRKIVATIIEAEAIRVESLHLPYAEMRKRWNHFITSRGFPDHHLMPRRRAAAHTAAISSVAPVTVPVPDNKQAETGSVAGSVSSSVLDGMAQLGTSERIVEELVEHQGLNPNQEAIERAQQQAAAAVSEANQLRAQVAAMQLQQHPRPQIRQAAPVSQGQLFNVPVSLPPLPVQPGASPAFAQVLQQKTTRHFASHIYANIIPAKDQEIDRLNALVTRLSGFFPENDPDRLELQREIAARFSKQPSGKKMFERRQEKLKKMKGELAAMEDHLQSYLHHMATLRETCILYSAQQENDAAKLFNMTAERATRVSQWEADVREQQDRKQKKIDRDAANLLRSKQPIILNRNKYVGEFLPTFLQPASGRPASAASISSSTYQAVQAQYEQDVDMDDVDEADV